MQITSDPTFTSPPVTEVVAGVALEGSGAEATALAIGFWRSHLRSSYPNLQKQPPYFPPIEKFEAGPSAPDLRALMVDAFPDPRFWATSPDGRELVQLQAGWFACNWRRVAPNDQYNRWATRRGAFSEMFQRYAGYLREQSAPPVIVTQCEVTYVNHIRPSSAWSSHEDLGRVFGVSVPEVPDGMSLEQGSFRLQFLMKSESRQNVGRLHVNVTPALDGDGASPLYVLEMTARGAPAEGTLEGALDFMDLGRASINQAFVSLTSDRLHSDWGRTS